MELEATAARTPDGARTLLADLADRAACLAAAREAARFAARDLGAFVHCAGVLRRASLSATGLAGWDETLAVNLTSAFVFLEKLLPALAAADGGSVVLTSSRAGVSGFANEAAYCASKFGIEGLARALAAEWGARGVAVNTVTPGSRIKPTGMTAAAERDLPPEQRSWGPSEPLGAAFAALGLIRKASVTGQRFRCDIVAARVGALGLPLPSGAWDGLGE